MNGTFHDPRVARFAALLLRFDAMQNNSNIGEGTTQLITDLVSLLKDVFGDAIEDARVSRFRELIGKSDDFVVMIRNYTNQLDKVDAYSDDGPRGLGDAAAEIVALASELFKQTGIPMALSQRAYVAARADNRPDNPLPPKAYEGGDTGATAIAALRFLHQFFEDVGPMFLTRSWAEMYSKELANLAAGDQSLLSLMIPRRNRQNKVSVYYYDLRAKAVLYAKLKAAIEGCSYKDILSRISILDAETLSGWRKAVPEEDRDHAEAIGIKIAKGDTLTAAEEVDARAILQYDEAELKTLLSCLPHLK